MKCFMLMAVLAFSYGAEADSTGGSIHSIVRGQKGEPHLIKYQSGEVKILESHETKKLTVYENNLEASKSLSSLGLASRDFFSPNSDFEPTIVADESLATIFKNMNPFMKRKSECSDRAHVWAWDEFKRSGTKSEKAFLMLTDTYIRRHRYKWWFHVAPLYTTTSGKKMVMDKQFLDHPVTFEEWKNHLVFTKRECVTDFRFLDYNAGADQSQDCYSMFQPMYYHIPAEIGALEQGNPRTGWNEFQITPIRARTFYGRN